VDRHEPADGPDHPQRTSNPSKDRRQGIVQLVLIPLFIGGAFILYSYLAAFETPPEPEAPDRDPAILVRTQVVAPQAHALHFSGTGTVQVRALADLVPQVSGRVVDIDERAFPGGVFTSETILFRIEDAFLGHLILGYDLSFISLFGLVALTGVVINDSVVLIDYYNRQRRQGGGSQAAEKNARDNTVDALEQAVRRRFRPILLTTMTTSLALLPMLLETSLQARFLIPMAISLGFGLLFASMVMLFLLPAMIMMVDDVRRRIVR
jgi:Cu/Ag efflux pump CusA